MLELVLYISVFILVVYVAVALLTISFLYIALKRAMSKAAGSELIMTPRSFFNAMCMCYGVFTEMVRTDMAYALIYTPLFMVSAPDLALNSFHGPFDAMIDSGDITFQRDFD